MKTADLEGAALDWAVAKCEGHSPIVGRNPYGIGVILSHYDGPSSTEWQYGGPIIEREAIMVYQNEPNCWWANSSRHAFQQTEVDGWGMASIFSPAQSYNGPTPLIAAMRCYVASKLGDEVEMPEELK